MSGRLPDWAWQQAAALRPWRGSIAQQFTPVHANAVRRFDPKSHPVAADLQNRDCDLILNANRLATFATEHEHL